MTAGSRGAIGFAEKVLELLDEGRYTATYKFAVLLALIDVCLERTQAYGSPPDTVTTRQLAEKIVEIYWSHTLPFVSRSSLAVLKQNTVGQAEILSAIVRFRERYTPDPSVPRWGSRLAAPRAYEQLVKQVEWKLIEMPLPRLQMMGKTPQAFIYEINWDRRVEQREVSRYQRGDASNFDNRVLLKPGVAEYLLQLSGLLRPLIQRRWSAMVAQLNRLEESQLDEFLFGAHRTPTATIRTGLWELQHGRCFYCESAVREPAQAEVDHFLPWSRYPDDGLDNLVVADKKCNADKSNSLAAAGHVERWARRFAESSEEHARLSELAQHASWDRQTVRTLGVARAIYLRLPDDARLWLRQKSFVPPDSTAIASALTAPSSGE